MAPALKRAAQRCGAAAGEPCGLGRRWPPGHEPTLSVQLTLFHTCSSSGSPRPAAQPRDWPPWGPLTSPMRSRQCYDPSPTYEKQKQDLNPGQSDTSGQTLM